MDSIKTHLKINQKLCGVPIKIGEGFATVRIILTDEMAVDSFGLIHGGFLFGVADYSAMLAVNDPNVVLAQSSFKFVKPSKIGDILEARAKVMNKDGKKYTVFVDIFKNDLLIGTGEFLCAVLSKHVLAP
jgi:acyl-coenzyme A thioesterase PaaI-like protein